MRISDWSSDVCSSDLYRMRRLRGPGPDAAMAPSGGAAAASPGPGSRRRAPHREGAGMVVKVVASPEGGRVVGSDIEIARAARLRPIEEIAARLEIPKAAPYPSRPPIATMLLPSIYWPQYHTRTTSCRGTLCRSV